MVIGFGAGLAGVPKVSGIELVTGYRTNAGGMGVGYWETDQYYQGGGLTMLPNLAINVGAAGAAPAAVYQSDRYGYAYYTIPGLAPNTAYTLNLHFAEVIANAAGQREFNVAVNGILRECVGKVDESGSLGDGAVDLPIRARALQD